MLGLLVAVHLGLQSNQSNQLEVSPRRGIQLWLDCDGCKVPQIRKLKDQYRSFQLSLSAVRVLTCTCVRTFLRQSTENGWPTTHGSDFVVRRRQRGFNYQFDTGEEDDTVPQNCVEPTGRYRIPCCFHCIFHNHTCLSSPTQSRNQYFSSILFLYYIPN